MKLDFLMDNAEQAQMWRFVAQAVAIRDNMVAQQNSSNILQGVKMTSLYTQTHRSVTYANDAVSLHSHDFYELLLCRSSCSPEYLVGSERYLLRKGDIILIRPGVSHRSLLRKDVSGPYNRDVLWVSQRMIDMLFQLDEELNTLAPACVLRTTGTQWEFLPDLFHKGVVESEKRGIGWQSMVLANTIQILICLFRASQDPQDNSSCKEKTVLLDRIMAYLEENFATRVTLADTANHFYVSESTITHMFHNKMGVSFYRCLTQLRLIHAKSLIVEGVPMSDVGQQVGFADYSTFYRAFKKEYGISPQQYLSYYRAAAGQIVVDLPWNIDSSQL